MFSTHYNSTAEADAADETSKHLAVESDPQPDLHYDESDTSSVEMLTGVSKVEAAQSVW